MKKVISLPLVAFIVSIITHTVRMWPTPFADFPRRLDRFDGESVLAWGGKMEPSEVGLYELELIPGVSEKTARDLLIDREHRGMKPTDTLMLSKSKKNLLSPYLRGF